MPLRRLLNVLVSCSLLWQSFSLALFFPLTHVATQSAAAAPLSSVAVFQSPLPTPVPQATITPTPQPITSTVIVSETEAVVDVRGGRVAAGESPTANRRIQLDVPPGLFQRRTRVKIAPRVTGQAGTARVQVELTARDVASDTLLTEFAQAVTLTVDLNGVVDRAQLQPHEHLAIFYQTDNPDAPWSELVDTREVEPGVVQVPLTHFSVYAAGVSGDAPAGWKLKYNPPVVSTFSGAATFSYPIEVGPGRNGLQPSIVLGYSSRSVDGVININTEDSDGVPFGWSLDVASIARNGMKLQSDGGNMHMYFPERFSLSINGSNTDIFPATVGAHCGRYVAKDAPGLYIERRNDHYACSTGTTTNETHEYWMVKTGDGTTYRFGYNSDSEQKVTQNAGFARAEGYTGALCAGGGYCTGGASRWRVDQVTDVYGNAMTFHYHTSSTTETPTQMGSRSRPNIPVRMRSNIISRAARLLHASS